MPPKKEKVPVFLPSRQLTVNISQNDKPEKISMVLKKAEAGVAEWTKAAVFFTDMEMEDEFAAMLNAYESVLITRTVNEAEEPHVLRGLKALLPGQEHTYGQASNNFEEAIKDRIDEPLAQLGVGIIHYNQGRYKDALSAFSQLLKSNPQRAPNTVRQAIAMCWYRLGDRKKAVLSYKRMLAIDENSIPALIGLALLEVDCAKPTPKQYAQAAQYMQQAQNKGGANPVLISWTAIRHLDKILKETKPEEREKKIAAVLKLLANSGCEGSSNRVKATIYHTRGCLYHLQGDHQKAQQWYQQAIESFPEFPQPYYCCARVHMKQNQPEEACNKLRDALKILPEDYDFLLLLSQILIYRGEEGEAIKSLDKMSKLFPNDFTVWRYLGYLRRHDVPVATLAYAKAFECLGDNLDDPSVQELFSNVGLLNHQAAHYEEAEDYYNAAMSLTQEDSAEALVLRFNVARLREDQKLHDEAKERFQEVLARDPYFMDAYCALARLEVREGNRERAMQHLNQAIAKSKEKEENKESGPLSAEHYDVAQPMIMLGNILSEAKQYNLARSNYSKVLTDVGEHESHANLGLGFLYLTNALSKGADSRDKLCKAALGSFKKVVNSCRDASTIYATAGLGTLFANCRCYEDAHTVFAKVTESQALIPQTGREAMMINLGNTYLLKGQFTQATKTYQSILKRWPQTGHDYHLYAILGQAFFLNYNYKQAYSTLLLAVMMNPDDVNSWFNVALSQWLRAHQLLTKWVPTGEPNAEELREKIGASDTTEIDHIEDLYRLCQATFAAIANSQGRGRRKPPRGMVDKAGKYHRAVIHYMQKVAVLTNISGEKYEANEALRLDYNKAMDEIHLEETRRMEQLNAQRIQAEELREATIRGNRHELLAQDNRGEAGPEDYREFQNEEPPAKRRKAEGALPLESFKQEGGVEEQVDM